VQRRKSILFFVVGVHGKGKKYTKKKKIGLAYQSSCCSRIIAEKKIKTSRILIENTNGCA
jgi:hypothetical protein